jgi:hypothetical protein
MLQDESVDELLDRIDGIVFALADKLGLDRALEEMEKAVVQAADEYRFEKDH